MKPLKTSLLLLATLLLGACYEDKGSYDYLDSPKVEFQSRLSLDFSYLVGVPVEADAPLLFSQEVSDPDSLFQVEWYLNRQLVNTGYHLSYTFERAGSFDLIFKVRNRQTGETYISEAFPVSVANTFDWGWMILSDMGDGNSSLGFITPQNRALHRLEDGVDEPLGSDPISLHYYYVMNSEATGSYVAGVPKILVNQGSGSVTLDGNTLEKDMWLRDEFESGQEPEGLRVDALAYKNRYYVIASTEGDIYIRGVGYANHETPYYGHYSSLPVDFEGGSRITCFAPFRNVTYWCANEESCVMYDELHARFIGITDSGQYTGSYYPVITYFHTYDQDFQVPASVTMRPEDMGAGTRCLAIGSYEKVRTEPPYGALVFWPRYVALVDRHGTGDYQVYEFELSDWTYRTHLIGDLAQTPFTGADVLTERSVIHMSSNFERNPYFYFTDGDRRLYVYSMQAHEHRLAYTAQSRITHISNSPIVCEFSAYGGHQTTPNYRLALAQESGEVAVIDVAQPKMVQLFEGSSPRLELATLGGFGDIKGITWCTNFEGEY